MTDYAPPTEGVTTPLRAVPLCPDCKEPLGLFYAECATCAFHSCDYTYAEYQAASRRLI